MARAVIEVPRKSKFNRRKNFVAIPFNTQLALATLGSGDVLSISLLGAALGEDLFIISMDSYVAIRSLTAGEVPLFVGMAHGDLSVTEIQEAIDASLTDPDDIIARERARRPVRRMGVFGDGVLTHQTLQYNTDNRRTTVKFSVGDGHAINGWVGNESGGTLTTGAIVEWQGTIYGRWQR